MDQILASFFPAAVAAHTSGPLLYPLPAGYPFVEAFSRVIGDFGDCWSGMQISF
jgi:hypothetical protein